MLFTKSYICKMKFLGSVLLLLLTINAFAQINILVKDETSHGFQLGIDGFSQTKSPTSEYLVTNLDTSFHYIRIKVMANENKEFSKKIHFRQKGTYAFVLSQNFKGSFQLRYRGKDKDLNSGIKGHSLTMDKPWFAIVDSLVIVSNENPIEIPLITEDTTELQSEIKNPVGINSKPIDSSVSSVHAREDNIKVVPIRDSIQIENQASTKDSLLTANAERVEQIVVPKKNLDTTSIAVEPFPALLIELSKEEFEFNKLNRSKNYLIENAITVSQIQEVFKVFKYDNTRMQFLGFALERLINPEKLGDLLDSFDYDLTKERFRKEYL